MTARRGCIYAKGGHNVRSEGLLMIPDNTGPLSPDQIAILKRTVQAAFREAPPTIGVIGVSGVGKSSTINAMFKTDLPISHVAACTKEFLSTDLSAEIREQGAAQGEAAVLRVVDAPGLGEDISRDSDYLTMYDEQLPHCDVVLWVMAARNRGIALDQQYLKALKAHHHKIIFAVNQIELVEPMNWSRFNIPSLEQERNIDLIMSDRKSHLETVFEPPVELISYSAQKGYNLQELFTKLIMHCKDERSWMFGALKAFHPDDFIPAEYRSFVKEKIDGSRT